MGLSSVPTETSTRETLGGEDIALDLGASITPPTILGLTNVGPWSTSTPGLEKLRSSGTGVG